MEGEKEGGEKKEIQGKELFNPTYILYQHNEIQHLGEEILARKEKGKRSDPKRKRGQTRAAKGLS